MKTLYLALQARFTAMSQRERHFVIAAGLVVLVGLVWWIAIEPALKARARLTQQLPLLRLQASELAGLATQGTIRRSVSKTDLADSLSVSLTAAGFDAKAVELLDQDRARVRLTSVDYGKLVRWLDETQAASATLLESATITLQEPSQVNAELLFQRNRY
jgi:general secretion pathway protein M